LEKISAIPGHNSEGELDPDRIVNWVQKVRESAIELGCGAGGDDERKFTEKYENWVKALEFSYPRVAGILSNMAKSYLDDAVREDLRAGVTKRLME